jgi:hypothetical protein
MESEYLALSLGCRALLWIRALLRELGFDLPPTPVYCDNDAAVASIQSGHLTEASRHIDVAHKYARDLHRSGDIELRRVPSDENEADLLTKPLRKVKFTKFREMLGIRDKARSR